MSSFHCLFQSELEEIESRNETYPETRGFLDLVKGLLATTIPGSLGVGYRQPGLVPYLSFVKDAIFLKFDIRAYTDTNEMVSRYRLIISELRNYSSISLEF